MRGFDLVRLTARVVVVGILLGSTYGSSATTCEPGRELMACAPLPPCTSSLTPPPIPGMPMLEKVVAGKVNRIGKKEREALAKALTFMRDLRAGGCFVPTPHISTGRLERELDLLHDAAPAGGSSTGDDAARVAFPHAASPTAALTGSGASSIER
jgi:hypothetical protein